MSYPVLPSSSVHCNSSKCSHFLLYREHWRHKVDVTSNFDHLFYKNFCICSHSLLSLFFSPVIWIGISFWQNLNLPHLIWIFSLYIFLVCLQATKPLLFQNLCLPSFCYLALCSFDMAQFLPIVITSRHTFNKTKQSLLLIQFTHSIPMRIQSYLSLLYFSQNFWKALSPFTSFIYSILKGIALGSKINSCL